MGSKMDYYVYNRPGKVDLQTMAIPSINTDEILVKLKAYGISTSDIKAYVAGKVDTLYSKPVGDIINVGKDVEGLEEGKRIFFGFPEKDIAFPQYVKLSCKYIEKRHIIEVPKNISLEDATLIGPFSNCFNTLKNVNFEVGDNAVVVGAGCMGLLHLLSLKIAGANMTIVSEINDYRIKKAEELGADYVVNPRIEDAVEKIKALTNGGADIVILATSNPAAIESSFKMVKNRGRINLFGGPAFEIGGATFTMDPWDLHYKELSFTGTYGSLPHHDSIAVNFIASKKVNFKGINSHRFSFKEFPEVLKLTDDSNALRAVVL